ncbi:PD-(D/E)XK nuclease family protein [Tenacibaculum finnmarkense genomovar ulcerans]|uniref:PDDEXK-like family protein n=1 Tax=Tenacibaculum finnmarkense TaxID=2781243 RepID=UPI001E3F7A22|nr:PD-(D/E)XK nuclease family protein [Tenacibaculum finnmarkense]MCD8455162.1 PD-(D/E)XK nuclease family protein [Tenacibaculum finnmarkense genomovar ulcerans]
MKDLFKEIKLLKNEYDLVREKEEQFNIFSIMYKSHNEVKLHSRFIASLLNPYGSHKKGYKFLKLFISLFENINYDSFKNTVVYPTEINKKEFNNIDILIINRTKKKAIIIENKIYAGDSNNSDGGQLERYFKYIRDNEKISPENITVFYLTLDGHSPSSESLGKFKTLEKINGNLISYEEDILKWLNLCLLEVSDKPFIRESINQYIKLLNKMTNNEINIDERKELKNIIGNSEESLTSTKYLIDNFKHVKWHTIFDFWNELKLELENKGFEIVNSINSESITHLTHYSQNKKEEELGIVFRTGNIEIYIWHTKSEFLYIGLEKTKNESINSLMNILLEKNKINENSFCWWNDIELKNGSKIYLKNFSNSNTFNLIDPIIRKQTIKEIISIIMNLITEIKNCG